MQIHFPTRKEARQAAFGKLVDNGANTQQGMRYARETQANVTGNNVHNMACPISGRQIPVFVRGKNKL